MKKLKSQSGRSMVEMLGVLAIIGVLSVGGIAGYSLSMRRHRANGIIDLASKLALVAYNKCQQKILNGEVTSVTECDQVSLYQTDIGSSPTGLRSDMYVPDASSGYSTDQTTGVDTVRVVIPFEDTKLCQAVASVAGTTCNDRDVSIKIKQN